MISHTVYRGMNNEIILQLLSDGDPLGQPSDIHDVTLGVVASGGLLESADDSAIEYDGEDGTLHMKLGRVPEITTLLDGIYQIEVTAYGNENVEGIAFGAFQIFLRDWTGELA